jgi:dihydrofolate synthase/folylpolyglutamate synthase
MQSIATEKAGIIKKNIPVVIGEYSPEIKDIFTAKANAMQADIYFASDLILQTYPSSLVGDYQVHNKKTALQTIQVLQKLPYFVVSEENIKSGFSGVIANTGLQGRWQQLEQYPKVIADTAHNKSGLEIVLNQIQNESFEKLHIVLGVVNDKDLDEILPLFPKKATYYFCKPNIPRGLEVAILQNQANKFGLFGHSYSSISEAYNVAMKNAGLNDFIYIGGSTFVVAEIL